MKVAIPVKGKTLGFFGNASHTLYFAIYSIKESGASKSLDLEELRANPRSDPDHDLADDAHQCSHDDNDEAHIKEYFKMGKILQDCHFLVTKKACKNTAKAMADYGMNIKKYTGTPAKADAVLNALSAQLG